MNNTTATRKEKDLLGERLIPDKALYGIQTLRAKENFKITNTKLKHYSELIIALAMVKKAAAITNFKLGILQKKNVKQSKVLVMK